MRLFLTGATGLIGRRLVVDRLERGDQVVVLSRDAVRAARLFAADANPNVEVVEGDPTRPGPWQEAINGCDGVIHLAGAGIADRRWTGPYKQELVSSRIESTRLVVQAMQRASRRPPVLLSGSAVGYYGEIGERETDESAPRAADSGDFLADLCERWEGEASRAVDLGVRVVTLRTGIVLDERGGAYSQLLRPIRLFVGGPIGLGRAFMPWVHHRDVTGLVEMALSRPGVAGPINLTSPNPARNRDLVAAIARSHHRPSWLPTPPFALRLVLGELGRYAMMSQRIIPGVAMSQGYGFLFPDIESAAADLAAAWRKLHGNGETTRVIAQINETVNSITPSEPPATGGTGTGRPAGDGAASTTTTSSPRAPDRPRRDRPPARVRLLAIDVDGTLLRSDGGLSQGVIDACRAAVRAGCVVIPATARPPRAMRTILQTLGLSGPTINYNGAVVWNPVEQKPQHHESMDAALASSIIAEARAILPDTIVSVEILDRWFTDRVDARFHTETSRVFDPDYVGPIDSFLDQPITKLMLLEDPGRLSPVLEMIRDRYWRQRRIAMFLTDPHLIQIVSPMVDKSIALQRLAHRLGVSRDEVMTIGDGPNDAGMIEWAGFSVAVENACPLVRDLADVVVPSNDDQGVAKAIHRYVLAPI